MRTRIVILSLTLAPLLFASLSGGQLSSPNDSGVSVGQVYLVVADVGASVQFWANLGGVPFKFGPGMGVKFPGVLILLRKGEPTGGTVGSVINHIGFRVLDVQESLPKWKAAGATIESTHGPKQAFLFTPDALTRIEMIQDETLPAPIGFHHIHFFVAASDATADPREDVQAWYVKVFGAKPGKRGPFLTAALPGGELTLTKSDSPVVGTKGRSLDHIGFEIKNLEVFCNNAEARGVKFDTPCMKRADFGMSSAFLTDPWGTSIELTEGLDRY